MFGCNYYSYLNNIYFIWALVISYVIQAISYYRLAEKADLNNRWIAFIPFFQFIIFFHIIDKSAWNILFAFIIIIPFIGPLILAILYIVWYVEFYQRFKTPTIWMVLSIIFILVAWIYLLYMAFCYKVRYIGVNKFSKRKF
ncbi:MULTISPECIES: DUF5684 domain-containing protein [Clostridiaceae]|uniref:DUF5684 domain-containing protein n=1 Tax=Clostridiaceae TaxID=31979 RepID=UPI00068FAE81|nr:MULTISPECIES: DUF5684 domain-containing protein [Clostridiaceae]